MSLDALPHATTLAASGDLAHLRRAARAGDAEAARVTAQQFEALFVQMMIKQMREAMPTDGGLFGGEGMKLYESMHDQQLSLALAQRGGIGLAASIERQLLNGDAASLGRAPDGERQLHFPTHRLPARPAPLVALERPAPAAPTAPTTTIGQAEPGSREAFVRRVWPHAQRAAARLGVAPEVLVAQSALETGWGRHMIRHADGRSSHNLFGIKATGGWQGDRVSVTTLEYRDGVAQRERAAFRGYRDEAASFADYARLIGGHPRYQGALASASSPEGYLRALQSAGYATDPAYADKILGILERGLPGLQQASPGGAGHATLKPAPARPIPVETGTPGIARIRPSAGEENRT